MFCVASCVKLCLPLTATCCFGVLIHISEDAGNVAASDTVKDTGGGTDRETVSDEDKDTGRDRRRQMQTIVELHSCECP